MNNTTKTTRAIILGGYKALQGENLIIKEIKNYQGKLSFIRFTTPHQPDDMFTVFEFEADFERMDIYTCNSSGDVYNRTTYYTDDWLELF